MRIVITAGGTGGHIYPAIAIIEKVKELEPGSEILYIGTTDRMEKDIIPKLKIPYVGIEMKGIDRKHLWKNISVYFTFRKAIKTAKKEISKFHPDIVVGVGGYISAPVILAAHKLKYKTLIHEQNSTPGVSNKHIAKYVDCVCVSLPDTLTKFENKNVVYTGNPRSEQIIQARPAKKADFGLDEARKLVIICMGSLGSATMTEKLKELIPALKDKPYQIVLVTGKSYYDDYKGIKVPENVGIAPYLDNLIELMKKADLFVSRAGASTIAELTAIGLPSILVPSPYVTENHQMKNAQELEKIKATRIIPEKDFSKDTLIPIIDEILSDPGLYKSMKLSTKSLGVANSATKVYQEIKKVIGE